MKKSELYKQTILAFIESENAIAARENRPPRRLGKKELVKAFGVLGANRILLKASLEELEAEGAFGPQGARKADASVADTITAEITGKARTDQWHARPVARSAEPDELPQHILVSLRPIGDLPRSLSKGDRVLVRLQSQSANGMRQGHVLRVLKRARPPVLGIFHATPDGGGWLTSVEKKNMGLQWQISPHDAKELHDGDLLIAETQSVRGRPKAKIRDRLGPALGEKAMSNIALLSHHIPHVFSEAALKEADAARPAALGSREDWRSLALITIDPADAKDHDDAVHAAPDSDLTNPGGFILTVAIADVAAYVRPNSTLDREALERGNSVYFPDRVVPMLPEVISNDLCSLRPQEDRPSLAVKIWLSADGHKLRHSFHRILMRSHAKLAYEQAQAAIEGAPNEVDPNLIENVLRPLWTCYRALEKARSGRAPLELDLPGRKLFLREDGTVERVFEPPRLEAHRLIEECMIAANVAAAETLEEKRQMLLYRAHDEPSAEKIMALGAFLASLGIKLAAGTTLRPSHFNAILRQLRGSPNDHLAQEMILRSQAQAEYVAQNYGHFGLNLPRYAHFTSPIRRYSDLIVHRALIRALELGEDGLPAMSLHQLAEIAQSLSAAERRAAQAERDTIERLIAGFLSERIGAEFEGRISGVIGSGLFVRLSDTGADGFVSAATLGNDYYRLEEGIHALVGTRTRRGFQLGDQVKVLLASADPLAGALRFVLLSPAKPIEVSRSGTSKRRESFRAR